MNNFRGLLHCCRFALLIQPVVASEIGCYDIQGRSDTLWCRSSEGLNRTQSLYNLLRALFGQGARYDSVLVRRRLGRDFPVRARPVQPHEVVRQVRNMLLGSQSRRRRLPGLSFLLREGHGEDRPYCLIIPGSTHNINDLPRDRVQAILGLFDAWSVRDAGRHAR